MLSNDKRKKLFPKQKLFLAQTKVCEVTLNFNVNVMYVNTNRL